MRKPVSSRRQKKVVNNTTSSLLENTQESPNNVELIDNNAQKLEGYSAQKSIQDQLKETGELLLELNRNIQLVQEDLKVTKSNQETLQNSMHECRTLLENNSELYAQVEHIKAVLDSQNLHFSNDKKFLQQSISELTSKVTKLEDIPDRIQTSLGLVKSELVEKLSLLDNIISEIKVSRNSHVSDYKTLLSFLLDKKQDIDTERTISFQLGKTLIDGSRNLGRMVELPKKLLELKKEAEGRRTKKINVVEKNVEILKKVLPSPSVKKVTLDNLLELNKKTQFNGNLIDELIFKNHELISFDYADKTLSIVSKKDLVKPRYFNSLEKIDLKSIEDYITNNKLIVESKTISEGLSVELIISFFDKLDSKLKFNIINLNKLSYIDIPQDSAKISLGLKIEGDGSFKLLESALRNDINKNIVSVADKLKLKKGVSIIIPSYKGEDTIEETLKSIRNQANISSKLIEVVCVINGPIDRTREIIEKFQKDNSCIEIKVLYSEIANASVARNIAIENASREYSIFLDDDDQISSNYISEMYNLMDQNSVVFSYIYDVSETGIINKNTEINKQLISSKDNINLNSVTSAVTMIASKMLPTAKLKNISFV